jgi:sporulation protein YlmC with PRC-barrel domain
MEGNMAEYKFDRNELRDRHGSKVAVLDGKYIRDNRGSRWGEIDGKYFKDSHGARLAEFDGRDVRDSHGSRIASIDDVKKSIDGIGGSSLVAMWLFFVR